MLTDVQIRQAKPKTRPYKLHDGEGLYVLISSKSKRWYFRYSYGGKRIDRPLGKYPAVSLLDARKTAIEAQIALEKGEDPFAVALRAITFSEAFEVLFKLDAQHLAASTMKDRRGRYCKYVQTIIGDTPLNEITPQDVLSIVRPLHDSGREELAKKVRVLIGQVCRDGVVRYGLTYDPTQAAQKLRKQRRTNHYPHIEDKVLLGRLMADIARGNNAHTHVVRIAMRVLP